jgi:multiple sugar transport system permease protein
MTSAPIPTRKRFRRRSVVRSAFLYALICALTVVMLLPLYWMVVTALTPTGLEFAYPPHLIPPTIAWSNITTALTALPFGTFYKNSFFYAILATAGCLATESMVGYGFARFRFPGRDILFGLCLATMMLPFVVTLIPRFVLFRNIGLFNTLWPLIIPWWFGGTPFAIFLFRQFYRGLPRELDEAAQMDGAGHLRAWWSVVLPQSWAIFAALGILHFVWFWNDFLGPLIYVNSDSSTPLSTGIYQFAGGNNHQEWNYMMVGALAMVIPIVIVVLAGQRYFRRGITVTGFGGR